MQNQSELIEKQKQAWFKLCEAHDAYAENTRDKLLKNNFVMADREYVKIHRALSNTRLPRRAHEEREKERATIDIPQLEPALD